MIFFSRSNFFVHPHLIMSSTDDAVAKEEHLHSLLAAPPPPRGRPSPAPKGSNTMDDDLFEKDAVAKKEQLTTLQTAPPPPNGRPKPSLNSLATDYDDLQSVNAEEEEEEEVATAIDRSTAVTAATMKVLKGRRSINGTNYDFTLLAELDLQSPLDSVLRVKCVSEYFDESEMTTTARVAKELLRQLYPFDSDNYEKSTQHVIYHSLKIFSMNENQQLILIDAPSLVAAPEPARGARVVKARARGTYQRREDESHRMATLDFSEGSLGIELEDRPSKIFFFLLSLTQHIYFSNCRI